MKPGCDGNHADDNDCPNPAWDDIHKRHYCPTLLAWSMTVDIAIEHARWQYLVARGEIR